MELYAVINSQTNICENVCVWDGATPWSPPTGYYAVALGDSGAGIGWSYDPNTQTWTAPPPSEVDPDAGAEPPVP